jgi:hypothetical protein
MSTLKIIGGCLIDAVGFALYNTETVERFESFSSLRGRLADENRLSGKWNVFSRFTPAAKQFCMACALALDDAALVGTDALPLPRCGIVVCDNFEHEEDLSGYYRDYLAGGKQLGRSSLFVHTLPTSAAADASVCLGLGGPILYWRDDDAPLEGLISAAAGMLADGSANQIIAGMRDGERVLCMVLALAGGIDFSGADKVYAILKAIRSGGQ